MTGIKKFKKLDSIGKKARKFSMNQRCCVCQFATICTPATSEICTVIYEKGFRRGYNQRKEEEKDRKSVEGYIQECKKLLLKHETFIKEHGDPYGWRARTIDFLKKEIELIENGNTTTQAIIIQ